MDPRINTLTLTLLDRPNGIVIRGTVGRSIDSVRTAVKLRGCGHSRRTLAISGEQQKMRKTCHALAMKSSEDAQFGFSKIPQSSTDRCTQVICSVSI
jgi:hypothetical protein